MPKYRKDLVHPAFRIWEAIADNDWTVEPPHVRVDFTPIFGYEVLEIGTAFRLREPYRSLELERKRGKKRNQTTIPACYLHMRWVDLKADSPLWYLTEKPKDVRMVKGVFFDGEESQWKLLTYQVVEDMNHLRRAFVHIFASYQWELSKNDRLKREIELRVVSGRIFGPALPPRARAEMDAFQRWLDRREQNMGHIKGKLGARADLVHYFAERRQAVLHGIARTFEADATNLRRANQFHLENFRQHLSVERAKLDRMVSRNVRSLRRQAQRRIDKASDSAETDRRLAALHLEDAAQKLRAMALSLEVWAADMDNEEVLAANVYRGVVPLAR